MWRRGRQPKVHRLMNVDVHRPTEQVNREPLGIIRVGVWRDNIRLGEEQIRGARGGVRVWGLGRETENRHVPAITSFWREVLDEAVRGKQSLRRRPMPTMLRNAMDLDVNTQAKGERLSASRTAPGMKQQAEAPGADRPLCDTSTHCRVIEAHQELALRAEVDREVIIRDIEAVAERDDPQA